MLKIIYIINNMANVEILHQQVQGGLNSLADETDAVYKC